MLDTVVRQIAMLRLIPRHPKKIAVTEIHDRLAGAGYDVTVRTIQRDLISLVGAFAITSDDAKPQGWSWVGDPIQFPSLDPQGALTFSLVERFLKPLLPKATLASLDPHFKSAKVVLSSVPFRQACVTREVGHWYSPLDNEEDTNGQYDLESRQATFCGMAITAPEPPTHS